jgi:hypothetical protein
MIRLASYDLAKGTLRLAAQLWPLWLFWFVWTLFSDGWRSYLLTFPNRSAADYALACRDQEGGAQACRDVAAVRPGQR